jgi:pimeloyl-ACP methyl ester carboxylesterase
MQQTGMQQIWTEVVGERGVRLSVRVIESDAGPDAPGLLLHHGLASTQRIWDLMLASLARRHRVVTFDARGHGRSAKPSSGYGFETVAADAVAVARATKLRRPVIVGHSWGAMVALDVAVRRPRATAGVVLIDGGVGRLRDSFVSWPEAKAALAPPDLAGMPVEELRAKIPVFLGDAVAATPAIQQIVLSVMRVGHDGRIRPHLSHSHHFAILHAIWNQDPIALHQRLRVPALALVARPPIRVLGGNDPLVETKRAAVRAVKASGALTRFEWIEGIHDLPLQHPHRLARRIERFTAGAVG